jgi:hypothetical protein
MKKTANHEGTPVVGFYDKACHEYELIFTVAYNKDGYC